MKKVLLTLTVAAGLAMTSCGGLDMCSCFEKGMAIEKEMEAAGDDEAKVKEIEAKYKADEEACKAISEKMQAEMKDLTPEETKAKGEEFMESCPAMKEAMGGH